MTSAVNGGMTSLELPLPKISNPCMETIIIYYIDIGYFYCKFVDK